MVVRPGLLNTLANVTVLKLAGTYFGNRIWLYLFAFLFLQKKRKKLKKKQKKKKKQQKTTKKPPNSSIYCF